MYGLDPKEFKERIVVPALRTIGLAEPNRVSLVLGTCMHESHLRHVFQVSGPALGFGQMEPATHRDLWENFLRYQSELAAKVRTFLPSFEGYVPPTIELSCNARYAVAMAAVHYRRVRAALPENTPQLLAEYWKKFYNTELGKGTVAQALPHFQKACEV